MKKHIAALSLIVLPFMLCACGHKPLNDTDRKISEPNTRKAVTQEDTKTHRALPGVIRIAGRNAIGGNYTVEYIHACDKADATLDYELTLNDDNTFTLNVISNGVKANHYGHWYARRGEIMMFYDEKQPENAHNVYYSDSLYGDILPNNKIMLYDNCNIIVLAQAYQNA